VLKTARKKALAYGESSEREKQMYVLLMIFAISATDGVGWPSSALYLDPETSVPVIYTTLGDCTKASNAIKAVAANPMGTVRATRCEKLN